MSGRRRYDGRLDLMDRATGEVQVWTTERRDHASADAGLECLDVGERARAATFGRSLDRDRFIHAHAFLRRVLAGYVGVPAAFVGIASSVGGKPRLEPASDLAFSLSHTGDLTVVAVVRGRDVGIDVERLRQLPDALDLARSQFTGREVERLLSVPAAERPAAFLDLWTRKESVVKALGAGLSIPLDTFEVPPDRHGWVTPSQDVPEPVRFWVAPIEVPAGYVGAVAVTGTALPVRGMGSLPTS